MSLRSDSADATDENVSRMLAAEYRSAIQVVREVANNVYAVGFNEGLKQATEILSHAPDEQLLSPELQNLIGFQALELETRDEFLSTSVQHDAQTVLNILSSKERNTFAGTLSNWLEHVRSLGRNDGLERAAEVADAWYRERVTATKLPARIRDSKTKPRSPLPPEATKWVSYPLAPWRRFFARTFDILFNGTISFLVFLIILEVVAPGSNERLLRIYESPFSIFFDNFMIVVLSLPSTAILVGLTGWSLGKWLCGVRIVSRDGNPIGVVKGMRREILLWIAGLGLGILYVNLVTYFIAYKRLMRKGATLWDESVDAVVLNRRPSALQSTLMALGFAVYFALYVILRVLSD
jgi:uncharacterized RDD family membrane protein YckC